MSIPLQKLRFAALSLAVTGLVAALPGASVRADVVERVIAVVNDEALFLSQIRLRSIPFLDTIRSARSQEDRVRLRDELYHRLLEELVDEELVRQAAQELEIRVQQSEVDRAIENVMRQNNLTSADFWDAVRAQGYSESQYRADVARQLLRLKVLNQRVRERVNITEDDVRREYDFQVRRVTRQLRFRASHIFFPLPADAGAPEVARVRQLAAEVRASITDEATFELAVEENTGGELGWLNEGDLPAPLEATLQTLQPGEVSAPVRGDAGYHIFFLHERERGEATVPTFEEARDAIYNTLLEDAMSHQEQLYLEELRRNATVVRRL
jgi:peptidyl-prolyl cis-trans isomerase SurA